MIGAGRDGIAVQQDLVARQIVLQLADLVFDIEQVVLIFEAGLLEGELLGRDLQLQRRIGQDDQRLAVFTMAPSSTSTCLTVPPWSVVR